MPKYHLTIVTVKQITTTKIIKAVDRDEAFKKAAKLDKPAKYNSDGDYTKIDVKTIKEIKTWI